MVLLIVFFLISILFSFLCSIWEAVLLSIPPSFVQIKLQEGGVVGKRLKKFKDTIDKPLAGILTLNTFAHTIGAIGVGAQATKLFGDTEIHIGDVSLPVTYEALVAALMTLAILILSEIIPKTLGASYWKQLTPFTVNSLHIVGKILMPFIAVSQFITKKLKKDKDKSVLSRADFTAMADIGEKEGIFFDGESRIIRNLLRFNSIRAKDIMTPRTVIVAAPLTQSIKEYYEGNPKMRFSRIPIYDTSRDNITSYVLKDEILESLLKEKGDDPLSSISREISIVNDQYLIPDLFNHFMEKREHIALVVGEFGGVAGIVTMEDIIETLIGMEIVDEYDNIEDMQALARKKWEKRAKELGLLQSDPSKLEEKS